MTDRSTTVSRRRGERGVRPIDVSAGRRVRKLGREASLAGWPIRRAGCGLDPATGRGRQRSSEHRRRRDCGRGAPIRLYF
jgi:hypothetical protein